MSVSTGIPLTEKGVSELSALLGEPDWLRERRLAAFRLFQELPLPTWDRTDLTGLSLDGLTVHDGVQSEMATDALPGSMQAVVRERSDDSVLFIQVDSGQVWARMPESLRAQGVVVCDFQTALKEHEEILKEHYGKTVPYDEDKLIALHYAVASSGYLVYVPKNTAVETPIELRIHGETPGLGVFPHILVVADQGSEVTVVESVTSDDGDQQRVVSQVVELRPADGAQIRYGAVQNWGTRTFNFTTRRADIPRDARVEWMGGDFGSQLSRSHNRSVLRGTASESTSHSVFFGVGSQHLDIGITMQHVGDHSASDMLTKGVLNDRARVVYRGLTDIENGARYTSGFQRENTMLLSKEARSDAIPGLEIDETEVQAGHAATVGQLDPVYLFYLMSRGLPRPTAIRLIVDGFFDPVLQRIPVSGVSDEIRALVDRKMSG